MSWTSSKVEYNCMSLDKLDPDKGYMIDNVVFCCYGINTMKWNNTEEEFYDLMIKILKYKNKLSPDGTTI